jgi:hypothetical protein
MITLHWRTTNCEAGCDLANPALAARKRSVLAAIFERPIGIMTPPTYVY